MPHLSRTLGLLALTGWGHAQEARPAPDPASIHAWGKISGDTPGLPGGLNPGRRFGEVLAAIGDLDGDGVTELAATKLTLDRYSIRILFPRRDGTVARVQTLEGFSTRRPLFLGTVGDLDGDGTPDLLVGDHGRAVDFPLPGIAGRLWVVFLRPDGTPRARQEVGDEAGGLEGLVPDGDLFGQSLCGIGDLDGDGLSEIAVGGSAADGGGSVWVLFPRADGTVRAWTRTAGLPGLETGDRFGESVAAAGDFDGDGVRDLWVGAPGDDDVRSSSGALWLCLLRADGSVRDTRKIKVPGLEASALFGSSVARIGDLDGDGIEELGAGATQQTARGLAWVLFLNADGTLRTSRSIASQVALNGRFGASACALGDLDGDGLPDLAIGAAADLFGSIALLYLEADGRVRTREKVFDGPVDSIGLIGEQDWLGSSVVPLGDLDGDGIDELAVGALGGGRNREGAVWILTPRRDGTLARALEICRDLNGGPADLPLGGRFGAALANLGDLDGDGVVDLAVGSPEPVFNGSLLGRVDVLFLAADGTVKSSRQLPSPPGLTQRGSYGCSLASLGDLDGDGTTELAVGGRLDAEGGTGAGALWVLFLDPTGGVKRMQKINRVQGGFDGDAVAGDELGTALAALGDVDGDGIPDLAVSAPRHRVFGALFQGALYILFLEADGRVRATQEIGRGTGGLAELPAYSFLGSGLTAMADLDHDGILDLATRNSLDVLVLALDSSGRVRETRRLPLESIEGMAVGDDVGVNMACLGDWNGDGLPDLALGAPGDDDQGTDKGALWLLFLDGEALLDFETRDDLRTPLRNGEALTSPPHFGRSVRLQASGANLGLAAFDSTPDGPNAGGPDPDLLVDLGQLLVFQDSLQPTQSVPGVFDVPGDDADGGLVTFTFPAPVEPHSLTLVDLDLERGHAAKLTLTDQAGRTRVYSVPAGWTEDLVRDGPPAWRALDLTTLAPQPGFRASVTASEDAGFAPRAVTRLTLGLSGSGGLDSLRWIPHPTPDRGPPLLRRR